MLKSTWMSLSNKADTVIPCLPAGGTEFPSPGQALIDPPGLLAFGGDLSPQQLLAAYRIGAFPWYSEPDPILWWHPDPRAVILPDTLHIARSLTRQLRQNPFRVTVDQAFADVIRHCADGSSINREQGTWITPLMRRAYTDLHHAGYAHSVEVWQGDTLVGGMYGVALGRVFHGESMFSHQPNASRAALAVLAQWLFGSGFVLLDCQIMNPHTRAFGAIEIPQTRFVEYLDANRDATDRNDWPQVLCE